MVEQLALDFTASRHQRHKSAVKAVLGQPSLFPNYNIDIDVHLLDRNTSVATFAGAEPERAAAWLTLLLGELDVINAKRVRIPNTALHRLLAPIPPARVTLDAAAVTVARAQWAHQTGLPPMRLERHQTRVYARSLRGAWPIDMRVSDAPWNAVAACLAAGLPIDVASDAHTLFNRRLGDANMKVADGVLSGTSVGLYTMYPHVLENLGLDGLAYDGPTGSGRYKLALPLCADLLDNPRISLTPAATKAVKQTLRRPAPLTMLPAGFPWTLYGFQAIDGGHALKIVKQTGGVLLAGDMGSGKTTVSLALVGVLNTWPLLVVAPLSAFSTWQRQLSQWGKSFYLATESQQKSWDTIAAGGVEAVVISYDRLPAFADLIETCGFQAVIADEIQRIRTPGSKRSRALRSIAASIPTRIGLSGTPITNTISDVLPVGSFLTPGQWAPRANTRALQDVYPGDPQAALTANLHTLMVRRRMSEVPADLPKRVDHRIFVDLTTHQRQALADLSDTTRQQETAGAFAGPQGRIHAFSRLQQMRKIINDPVGAGVGGTNPKVAAAMDLVCDLTALGRKGVVFCADRSVFRELGHQLDAAGIGWVGMWGATKAEDRIANENRFHTDPAIQVVLCTIQAGSESWSASPTATWLVSVSYMYTPSILAQMEARVYRMNSDPKGPDIQICYVHAQAPEGTLDDRMLEIVNVKKELFAAVVDQRAHVDTTATHVDMNDLLFMITGTRR